MKVSASLVRTCSILMILQSSVTGKENSLPYQPNANEECTSKDTEYLHDEINLCCSKCRPGMRLKTECSQLSDTECEPCPRNQYIENWNYSPKCFTCTKCQEKKGLQYAQNCSSTVPSRCKCGSEMYCSFGYDAPYCSHCQSYSLCEPGSGISQKKAGDTNVKCVPCGDGSFSDELSYEQLCEPHTDCLSQGRTVVNRGNATSDNVCGQLPSKTSPVPKSTTMRTKVYSLMASTVLPILPFFPTNISVDTAQPSNTSNLKWTVACYVIGFVGLPVLVLVIVWLNKCKVKQNEAINANGNKEEKVKMDCKGPEQAQHSFSYIQEEQCLLEAGELSRTDSQRNGVTNDFLVLESPESQSIGPLQSTGRSLGPQPSEPNTMPNLKRMEADHINNLLNPNSQPNSPQMNVSIIFNLGNGSHVIVPKDSVQRSPELIERNECFSEPQQEDGKRPLVAVQESCDHFIKKKRL